MFSQCCCSQHKNGRRRIKRPPQPAPIARACTCVALETHAKHNGALLVSLGRVRFTWQAWPYWSPLSVEGACTSDSLLDSCRGTPSEWAQARVAFDPQPRRVTSTGAWSFYSPRSFHAHETSPLTGALPQQRQRPTVPLCPCRAPMQCAREVWPHILGCQPGHGRGSKHTLGLERSESRIAWVSSDLAPSALWHSPPTHMGSSRMSPTATQVRAYKEGCY